MVIPHWLVAVLLVTILILSIITWSVKRRRRPKLHLDTEQNLDELIPSIVGLTQGTLVGGNDVRLLQNGAFFDELFADLGRAKKTINLETFLCKSGEVTKRIADVLEKKAREKVEVRLLVDGNGSRKFGKEELKQMDEAGVRIAKYHPIRISNLGLLNNRDHRKIVVIDGRIAYVGGHCLVDSWLGEAQDKKHFRDISARVEGPVVQQLQSAFSENWIEETGAVLGADELFPPLEDAGDMKAHVVFVSPAGSPSCVRLLHYVAISGAKKKITIQNPYFLPDKEARDALVDAVKRGVDVRVMIPHEKASDSPLVQHASHHHYGTLLKGGVKIFDYERTLLHQKVMTIDGKWAAVGSTNFDNRSFELNDEVTLVVVDKRIAKELEETFEEDLKHAKQRDLASWAKRPWKHKLIDFSAYTIKAQL